LGENPRRGSLDLVTVRTYSSCCPALVPLDSVMPPGRGSPGSRAGPSFLINQMLPATPVRMPAGHVPKAYSSRLICPLDPPLCYSPWWCLDCLDGDAQRPRPGGLVSLQTKVNAVGFKGHYALGRPLIHSSSSCRQADPWALKPGPPVCPRARTQASRLGGQP